MANEKDFVIENGVLKEYTGEGGDVIIPEGVTKIHDYAFHILLDDEKVRTLTLPASYDDYFHFYLKSLKNLSAIYVDKNNPKFYDIDGVLYSAKTLIRVPPKRDLYTFPDHITHIERRAFLHCQFAELTIPQNIKKIDEDAFQWSKIGLLTVKTSSDTEEIPPILADEKWMDWFTCHPIWIPGQHLELIEKHKLIAAYGFVKATMRGAEVELELSAEYKKYISSQRKKIYSTVYFDRDMLCYMIQEKIIPITDIETCMNIADKCNDFEMKTMLLEYKNGFSSKEKEKAEENAVAIPTDTETYKKLFTTEKLKDGTLGIVNYKGSETDVYIPGKIGKAAVSTIGAEAFAADKKGRTWKQIQNCKNIKTVTIGEGITKIDFGAFRECSELTRVTIPTSVQKLDTPNVFDGCSQLQAISVDPKNPLYYDIDGVLHYVEPKNSKWKDVTLGVEHQIQKGTKKLIMYPPNKPGEKYSIEDGTMILGITSFRECNKLISISVPKSVTVIEWRAFSDCSSLSAIHVSPDNPFYYDREGVLFVKRNEVTALVKYPEGIEKTQYTIPEGVTSIMSLAFENCKKLKKITIPESVTSIGGRAINKCSSTLTIHAPAGSYAETYAEAYAKSEKFRFVAE